jgi:CRP-like cAMP-binding protein
MQLTLRFLTSDDQRLLEDRAERLTYRADEVIIAEGSRQAALYLVRRGRVRVERPDLGGTLQLTTLGAGEVFGEMAFVEDRVASASVVADGEVEVDVIDGSFVQALLYSVPGFAARFFQSLAVTLSARLRGTSDQSLL